MPIESPPTWRGQTETFMGRSFDLDQTDRVLIVDDWITTGSTLIAARTMIEQLGATYLGAAALMNKATAETIAEHKVHTLVEFDTIMQRHDR